MDNNPDSPDSISSDQLTVDLLTPRSKRRRMVVINDIDRCNIQETADLAKNTNGNSNNNNNNNSSTNNNDVGFVLIEEEHQENGDNDDDDVRIFAQTCLNF
ncbi:AP-2 [Trypoxylus dichotomus]